jgi:hypothetical protein
MRMESQKSDLNARLGLEDGMDFARKRKAEIKQ